jgi:hypothetical protein
VRVNERGIAFWQSVGFAATGETAPYKDGCVDSELVLFEKRIAPAADDGERAARDDGRAGGTC